MTEIHKIHTCHECGTTTTDWVVEVMADDDGPRERMRCRRAEACDRRRAEADAAPLTAAVPRR